MTARPGTGRAGACERASVAVRRCASSGGGGRLRVRGRALVQHLRGAPDDVAGRLRACERAFVPGAGGSPGEAFGRFAARVRAFVDDTRAGATAIAAAAVTVMTVGASALIIDHVWLVDQRDVLKTAADAAAIAATLEIDRQLEKNPHISDEDLKAALHPVAARYVFHNLLHLPDERLKRVAETIKVEIAEFDRAQRTVKVTAEADLGGTLLSRALPLLGNYEGPETTVAHAGVDSESTPVEVVLAVDVSGSMKHGLGKGGTGSRMDIVKRAAKDLVDVLEPDAHNRVAVGIVPWHLTVRLDDATARKWTDKRWAVYPKKRTYPVPYVCSSSDDSCTAVAPVVDTLPATAPRPWLGCFDGHRIEAGIAKVPEATPAALFALPSAVPFAQSYFQPEYGESYRCPTSALPISASHVCYEHRPDRYQQRRCSSDAPPLLPLSTDAAAIVRAVDALSPRFAGFTYSTLGVLWAQRMLEPGWRSVWGGAVHPADPATPGHAGLRKAIVLLTDGQDSYCEPSNGSRPNEDCSGTPLAVSRTEACAAAKTQRTEIFVVAAMPPKWVSKKMGQTLRACSSESDHDYPSGTRRPGATYVFLHNSTAADLEAAFADIARQLRTLRKVS